MTLLLMHQCGVFSIFGGWVGRGVMSCILFVFSAVFQITQRPELSEFQYHCSGKKQVFVRLLS